MGRFVYRKSIITLQPCVKWLQSPKWIKTQNWQQMMQTSIGKVVWMQCFNNLFKISEIVTIFL